MPKIKVELVYQNGDSRIKKCQIEENKVIIKKAKRGAGNPAYKATFNKGCIIEKRVGHFIWKRKQKRLMLRDGSSECVDFSKKNVDVPVWTRKDLAHFADAEVIKRSGRVKIKHELPLVFWILVALAFLQLLFSLSQGGIRF